MNSTLKSLRAAEDEKTASITVFWKFFKCLCQIHLYICSWQLNTECWLQKISENLFRLHKLWIYSKHLTFPQVAVFFFPAFTSSKAGIYMANNECAITALSQMPEAVFQNTTINSISHTNHATCTFQSLSSTIAGIQAKSMYAQ